MIKLTGIDINGDKKTIHWRLIAKNGHGPRVPTIASIILAKKLARQELSFQGATPCIEMISLDDFTKEVEDLNITCEVY